MDDGNHSSHRITEEGRIAGRLLTVIGLGLALFPGRAAAGTLANQGAIGRGFQPDLILLDVLMPHLDGFTTCRRLKERPETRDIPIIFMTALTDTAEKVKGFELGARR